MNGFPATISTRQDLENLLPDDTYRPQALDYLQRLLDEQYGYDASHAWVLVGGGGLERLGLTRAEAAMLGGEDRVVAEPPYSGLTLAEAQAMRITEAKAAADAALAPLAARFSDFERQTWSAQLAEAQAILADPTLDESNYPTIAGIIAVTGESVADFAAAVLKNNEDWTRVSANVIGQRQALCAGVKACATLEEVLAFPVAVALPA